MRPANESRSPNGETLLKEEYWACFVLPFLFWLFASLTISLGYYGAKSTVIGPNYSHLIQTNSVFVSRIEVNAHQKGPVLYTFYALPVLGCRSIWSENHTMRLEQGHHQEYIVWLNKGSKLYVSAMTQSEGFYSILLTVSKGYSRRRKWFRSCTVWHSVQAWKEVHSEAGNLEYEAVQDGEYFVTVRNLNQMPVTIELQLEINATLYDTQLADTKCFLGGKSCKVFLPIFGNVYVMLATDVSGNNGINLSWQVEFLYGARWISYFAILAGVLLSVSALLKTLSRLPPQEQARSHGAGVEDGIQNSLLSSKNENLECTLNGSLDDESIDKFSGEDVANLQLCAVCFDAQTTVFFIPCGHAATCLACAKRLRHRDMGSCPLCRVKIEKMGRIFS